MTPGFHALRSSVVSLGLAAMITGTVLAKGPSADVTEALARFTKEDPSLAAGLKSAAGYAVFPSVKKAGLGIGAARGSGEVIVGGQAVGKTTLTQASIGLQAGGQEYLELIIFETAKAVADFKSGNFALGAQATAVAIKSGASANAKFKDGVKVLTIAKGGLMYEASVAGQKFGYDAY